MSTSSCPKLFEEGQRFARVPPIQVQPTGVLYVRQKEDAVTYWGDKLASGEKVLNVGTQDVLTCHVVVLHHITSGVVAIAHFDEYVREKRLCKLVNDFCEKVIDRTYWYEEDDDFSTDDWEWEDWDADDDKASDITDEQLSDLFQSIDLMLVGGYEEVSGKGAVLSRRILTFFAHHQLAFRLKLCCLGPVNTRRKGNPEPIVGGVVVAVKNGNFKPAAFKRTFVDSLPEEAIMTLMLGPSLIKKPFKLREMILSKEDEGFSKSRSSN